MEKSLYSSVTAAQGVYLCAVLGHLTLTTSSTKHFELTAKSETTARACDNLLRCLTPRSLKRKFGFISPTCWKLLETIAPVLADHSSTPGWLEFAAHFYPIFGMEYLLQVKVTLTPKYGKENYMRLVRMLLQLVQNIRGVPQEVKQLYQPFLERIFKLAPDEGTLLQLFADIQLLGRFFHYKDDREQFCVEFYKYYGQSRVQERASISEKLRQLNLLPKNLRNPLSGVIYGYLLEFITSVEKPTDEDVGNFLNLQISLNLNKEQTHEILMLVTTSQSTVCQDLLLKLLNDGRFEQQWQPVQRKTKVHICVTWLKTKVGADNGGKPNVTRTYEVAEQLLPCALVQSIKKELLDDVREWLFTSVAPVVILRELKDVDRFQQYDVRDSCIRLVEDVLRDHLRIVNDQGMLSQFSSSR